MFTGIIKQLGEVEAIKQQTGKVSLTIKANCISPEIDDSIAINGCCLTIVKLEHHPKINLNSYSLTFDVLPESLKKTNLSNLVVGDKVNLEESVQLTTKLGGHIIQGHVDCTVEVVKITPEGDSILYELKVPQPYHNMLVEKGFVSLDGVSLTVVNTTKEGFTVMIIPHTSKNTTITNWTVGSRVNLEVDIINKSIYSYLQKFNLLPSK